MTTATRTSQTREPRAHDFDFENPDRPALQLPELGWEVDGMRMALAYFLADWRDAEFISSAKAERFHRLVRILACRAGLKRAEVLEALRADADWLRGGDLG